MVDPDTMKSLAMKQDALVNELTIVPLHYISPGLASFLWSHQTRNTTFYRVLVTGATISTAVGAVVIGKWAYNKVK